MLFGLDIIESRSNLFEIPVDPVQMVSVDGDTIRSSKVAAYNRPVPATSRHSLKQYKQCQ